MNYKWLSNGFFALGIGLFAVAGVLYFWPEDGPGAFVADPERGEMKLSVGDNECRFRLHNPTRHKIRVVGASFC